MSLFSRRKDGESIRPGDIFRKLGTYGADWMVDRLFSYPDIPPHVRLVDQTSGRTMTVAASMLLDAECFAPLGRPEA